MNLRPPVLGAVLVLALAAAAGIGWTLFGREASAPPVPAAANAFIDDLVDGAPCGFCPEMIALPAGTLLMRGPPTGLVEENPPRVEVAAFALASKEVTRAQFGRFVEATGTLVGGCWQELRTGEYTFDGESSWRRPGFRQSDDHPVACVGFDDATAFTAWLAEVTGEPYRLPTEAEWAYAADRSTLDRGNIGLDRGRTTVVGSHGFDDQGFADLAGNVWEWAEDCWHRSHAGRPETAAARGEEDGGDCGGRTVRGLGWTSLALSPWRAERYGVGRDNRAWDRGFRVARDLQP